LQQVHIQYTYTHNNCVRIYSKYSYKKTHIHPQYEQARV